MWIFYVFVDSIAILISLEFQDACQNILCNTCVFFLSDVSWICCEVVRFWILCGDFFAFTMVFGNDERLMAWVADGYKHKLFADDAKNDDDIRPCDSDSFVLLPEEKTDTFAELRIVTPEPLAAGQKRIRSATHTRTNVPIKRPGTAPPRAEYVSPYSQRAISASRSSSPLAPRPPSSSSLRVGSAGSSRLSTKKYNELRKGFTLVSKLYNRSKESQNINLHPASPDPDFRYFDRHSRCYGYSHMHGHLLYDRPQTACDEHPCEDFSRPVSALSNASRLSHFHNDPASTNQPQRYINYHRPRSSPLTVGHLGGHGWAFSAILFILIKSWVRFDKILRKNLSFS